MANHSEFEFAISLGQDSAAPIGGGQLESAGHVNSKAVA